MEIFFSSSSFFAFLALILIVMYVFYYIRSPMYRYSKMGNTIGSACLVFVCKDAVVMAGDGLLSKFNKETNSFEALEEDVVKVFSVHQDLEVFPVMATYAGNHKLGEDLMDHLKKETKKMGNSRMTAREYAKLSYNFFVDNGLENLPRVHGAVMFAAYDNVNKKGIWTPEVAYADKGGFAIVKDRYYIGSGGMDAFMALGTQYHYKMKISDMVILAKKTLLNSAKYNGCTGGLTNIVVLTRDEVRVEPRVHIQDIAPGQKLMCGKRG